MTSLLEGRLASIIGNALVKSKLPYTLIIPRTEATSERPPDLPTWETWEPEEETTEHEFLGFVDTYSDFLVGQGVVDADDVKIVLIQSEMPFRPLKSDVIKARGQTYTILEISEDPAKATREIRAKG